MASTVNRGSYADAADKLTADTGTATAAQLATVADEILSVAGLLRARAPAAARADRPVARPAPTGPSLLRSLLAGKLAAGHRRRPDHAGGGPVESADRAPGRHRAARRRRGAAFGADKAGKLADVEDELFRFGQIVSGTPELAVTLSDPGAPTDRRVKLVEDLLKGKAQPATLRLVEVALEGFGGRSFESSLTRLVELTAAKRDREVAYVTVAKPLDDAEEQRLAAKLSDIYGRPVSLKIDVDPNDHRRCQCPGRLRPLRRHDPAPAHRGQAGVR